MKRRSTATIGCTERPSCLFSLVGRARVAEAVSSRPSGAWFGRALHKLGRSGGTSRGSRPLRCLPNARLSSNCRSVRLAFSPSRGGRASCPCPSRFPNGSWGTPVSGLRLPARRNGGLCVGSAIRGRRCRGWGGPWCGGAGSRFGVAPGGDPAGCGRMSAGFRSTVRDPAPRVPYVGAENFAGGFGWCQSVLRCRCASGVGLVLFVC
jgi:hypothetical protein